MNVLCRLSFSACSTSKVCLHLGCNRARQNLVAEIQKSVFGAVFPITGVWNSHRHFAKLLDEISAFRNKYTASCAVFLISY